MCYLLDDKDVVDVTRASHYARYDGSDTSLEYMTQRVSKACEWQNRRSFGIWSMEQLVDYVRQALLRTQIRCDV